MNKSITTKIHSAVPKENLKMVKDMLTKLGLNQIDSTVQYNLIKIGSKFQTYEEEKIIVRGGIVQIIGSQQHIAIFVSNNKGTWFRSSPVVGVVISGKTIKIETENSLYKLTLN